MGRVNVLYYHRVMDLKDDVSLLCVTPRKFEQQMRYLKSKYHILRFEENWCEYGGDSIVITFDDGYMDNFKYALPILEELEVPACFFVSTGLVDVDGEFWWDELENLILYGNGLPKMMIEDPIYGCEWRTDTYELRLNCYYAIHRLMKDYVDIQTRDLWMQQLRKQRNLSGKARDTHRHIDKKSLIRLAHSKYASIGAHTITHPSLMKLSTEEQWDEIFLSKKELESVTGKEVKSFSYPFGCEGEDFDRKTMELCADSGITKAASTTPGLWEENMKEYYKIPRNIVRNWGMEEFKNRIDSYWNL